jgi:uncharacterized protein YodC (DUF2158 family)
MPTKFVRGDLVKLKAVIPEGPITKLNMSEEGEITYLVKWADVDGVEQERWFTEDELDEA